MSNVPKDNTLSTYHYEAKKILCLMGMKYQIIHVCPNDCILYRKKFKTLTTCPRCRLSRYKVKDDNDDEDNMKAKMLLYLLIIPRFKHLFVNVNDAKKKSMQMKERVMDCYDMQLIYLNERKLIPSTHSLGMIQEIRDLVLQLMG